MMKLNPCFLFSLLLCSTVTAFNLISSCTAHVPLFVTCNPQERQALLTFKQGLADPLRKLSSWSDEHHNCCAWTGVHCNNATGRVRRLDLGSYFLSGRISKSLLDLRYLRYLNLSTNNFNRAPIPKFLGSMANLRHLDLSFGNFSGLVPPHLGNISGLTFLNLGNFDDISFPLYFNLSDIDDNILYVDNLQWVSKLSNLKYLSLDGVDLHREGDWLGVMNRLPSLSYLSLRVCQLHNMIQPTEFGNLTSLQVIHLSFNPFAMEIPPWLFNHTTNVVDFRIASCSLRGTLPETLTNLKSLQILGLGNNSLTGPIPTLIGNISTLRVLSLRENNFNGTLPESLGLLTFLTVLDITSNPLQGQLGERHFLKLSNLKELVVYNIPNLTLNVTSGWAPPFQLEHLQLHCRVGPLFPSWLRTQTSLHTLIMSGSSISGIVPAWFWIWTSRLYIIDVTDNQMSGDMTGIVLNSTVIMLSSNNLTGQMPQVPNHVQLLNIADNSISGSLSYWICKRMVLSNHLYFLDVSNNRFSGELGDCWGQLVSLEYLNLASNQFSGRIPNSLGVLHELRILSLRNNNFVGNIPSTFQKFTDLCFLDLSENQLSEGLPLWIWGMKNLEVLRLRSNQFGGHLGDMVCQLTSLIVLDLANNSLIGSLPTCFHEMKKMTISTIYGPSCLYDYRNVLDSRTLTVEISVLLFPKGNVLEYELDRVRIVRLIELSYNKLSGEIPSDITSLAALHYLILPGNRLHGHIPKDIGRMKSLETLDLSSNLLSGNIPQSMSSLSFLSALNLSYNQLSGPIPTSAQLQGFSVSSFIGNPELCGVPLPTKCTNDDESNDRHHTGVFENDDDDNSFLEPEDLYLGGGVGFAVGFWVVCCTLFFNRAWRNASFRVVQSIAEKAYAIVVMKVRSLEKKLRSLW